MTQLKQIPKFKNEAQESEFWATHDSTEYFDYSKRVKMDFSNLKPSTQKITLRLPKMLLKSLKKLANERDIPYQSFIKVLLNEKVQEIKIA